MDSRRHFEFVFVMKAAEDRPHGDAMADRVGVELLILSLNLRLGNVA